MHMAAYATVTVEPDEPVLAETTVQNPLGNLADAVANCKEKLGRAVLEV